MTRIKEFLQDRYRTGAVYMFLAGTALWTVGQFFGVCIGYNHGFEDGMRESKKVIEAVDSRNRACKRLESLRVIKQEDGAIELSKDLNKFDRKNQEMLEWYFR